MLDQCYRILWIQNTPFVTAVIQSWRQCCHLTGEWRTDCCRSPRPPSVLLQLGVVCDGKSFFSYFILLDNLSIYLFFYILAFSTGWLFLHGPDGQPKPVMARPNFIVSPVMLASCCPPELILESGSIGVLDSIWVILGHSAVIGYLNDTRLSQVDATTRHQAHPMRHARDTVEIWW